MASKLLPAPVAPYTASPLTVPLATPGAPLRIRRIAHAAVLIEHGRDALLTDPWFSQKGGFPGYYTGESLAMDIDQLPELTAVVTSQDHYDHFDIETFRRYRDHTVPLGVIAGTPQRDAAVANGFDNVRPLAPWSRSTLGAFTVTAVPAKPDKAPDAFEYEYAYVIEIGGRVVLFCSHMMSDASQAAVAQQFPRIDVALVGINGFRVRPQLNHKLSMDPADAAELCARLGVGVAVPIHYTFHGSWLSRALLFSYKGTPEGFTEAARASAPATTTVTLAPGQPLDLIAPATHKAAVETMIAKLDAGDWSAFELFAPDFIHHNLMPNTEGTPRQRAEAGMRALREAIPDLRIELQTVIADGDLVAVRLIQRGTPVQPLYGMPTGRRLAIPSSIMFRFRGEQIVEEWIDTGMPG